MNKTKYVRVALVLAGLLLMVSPFFKEEANFKSEIPIIATGGGIFMFALLRNKIARAAVLIFALFAIIYGFFL